MSQNHPQPPRHLTVSGLIIALVCIVGLFSFSFLIAIGFAEFRCEYYPLLVLATAIGFGIASSLLTGSATLRAGTQIEKYTTDPRIGLIYSAIQTLVGHPIVLSVSGGFAVFLLTLVIGHYLKPEICSDRQESTIRIEDIPSSARISMKGGKFWIKPHGHDLNARIQSISILAESSHTEGILHLHFEEQGTRCVLAITTADNYDSSRNNMMSIVESNISAQTLLITFSASPTVVAKNREIACFKRNHIPLTSRIVWNMGDRQLLTQQKDLEQPHQVLLDNPWFVHPVDATVHFQSRNVHAWDLWRLWEVAFADDGPPSYLTLLADLAHSSIEVRDIATQQMGKHFDSYASKALVDVFNSTTPPEVTAGILAALRIGIETFQPNLIPDARRKLNTPIEFLDGKEEELLELTGHENLSIQKSALEIVRRFPVDSFLSKYRYIVRSGNSIACTEEIGDQRVYGAIFYFANRGLQHIIDRDIHTIEKGRVEFAKTVDDVKEAALKCLDDKYSVDRSVLEFIPVMEILNLRPHKNQELMDAAKRFLNEIGDRKNDYYNPIHVFLALKILDGI